MPSRNDDATDGFTGICAVGRRVCLRIEVPSTGFTTAPRPRSSAIEASVGCRAIGMIPSQVFRSSHARG